MIFILFEQTALIWIKQKLKNSSKKIFTSMILYNIYIFHHKKRYGKN